MNCRAWFKSIFTQPESLKPQKEADRGISQQVNSQTKSRWKSIALPE